MLTASLVKFKLPFSLACDPPGELDRWPHGSVVINETWKHKTSILDELNVYILK